MTRSAEQQLVTKHSTVIRMHMNSCRVVVRVIRRSARNMRPFWKRLLIAKTLFGNVSLSLGDLPPWGPMADAYVLTKVDTLADWAPYQRLGPGWRCPLLMTAEQYAAMGYNERYRLSGRCRDRHWDDIHRISEGHVYEEEEQEDGDAQRRCSGRASRLVCVDVVSIQLLR
eukprot:SAG11_NODE_201_length_12551_cov_67.866126_9_plen_170_part_00